MYCKKCGTQLPSDAVECGSCGTRTRKAVGILPCPACGYVAMAPAKFCKKCGAAMQDRAQPAAVEKSPALTPLLIDSPLPAQSTSAVVSESSCPHCGAQVRAGAKFCKQCGKGPSEAALDATISPPTEEPLHDISQVAPEISLPRSAKIDPLPASAKNKTVALVVGILLLVISAAAIGYIQIRKRTLSEQSNSSPTAPANSADSASQVPPTSQAPPIEQPSTPPVQPTGTPNDVGQFLQTWSSSFLAGNFDAHMACYAPVVETYYGKRNLTRADVRREREGMVSKYGSVRQFDISNVDVTTTAEGRVEVKLRTHWELSGKEYFSGEDMEKLTLMRTEGGWSITSEEEPTVFWVKKKLESPSVKPDTNQPCKDPGKRPPCSEQAAPTGSTKANTSDVPSPTTPPPVVDPAQTVLNAFDAYIAGNAIGVTNLMSEEGARNAKTLCPGDAATCLRRNYEAFGSLQSRSADALRHDAASARIRLLSYWQKSTGPTSNVPQCQTYDLVLSAAGWRINSFSWPVPKSCL